MMKALPNTSFLPVPKSAPAGHTTAAAHLLWQIFPRYPCLEYKDYSGQSCSVRYTWTASFGRRLMFWQKWFNLTQIGRASCRERVYVSVVGGTRKKKKSELR